MDLKGKQVTVVGLGKSGFAAVRLLKRQGAKARVTEISAKDSVACLAKKLTKDAIEVEIGRHSEDFLKGTQLLVTSPGVPDTAFPLRWGRQNRIKVIDEIELAYRFCKPSPCAQGLGIIAVTGTNGKSTTASLIGHILSQSGKHAIVCGNIGRPFSGEIQNLKKDSVVVLEVSSFQLSRIDTFRPNIAVFLNATQNHLDRHSNFAGYFNAKMRIFKNQTDEDWAVLNAGDKNIVRATKNIKAKKIFFSPDNKNTLFNINDLQIKGRHNVENALAAAQATRAFGVSKEAIACAMKTFKGLEHRCEYVATINGVKFINDSKSTTVDSAIKALTSLEGNVILIAGGRDKNSDFTPMRKHVRNKVKSLVLIGEARDKIKNALKGSVDIKEAPSLEVAVKMAFDIADNGESVLLSPMCTSFDGFEDFEHRGRVFKEIVKRL